VQVRQPMASFAPNASETAITPASKTTLSNLSRVSILSLLGWFELTGTETAMCSLFFDLNAVSRLSFPTAAR